MASLDPEPEHAPTTRASTGELKPATGPLIAIAPAVELAPYFSRETILRFAEVTIFLISVIGAVALGLGITAYFASHRYVYAYLIAYAAFRFSDLLVRD